MIEKIKDLFKSSYGGIFLSLWFCFMLFIYEPINLYSSNMNDFWFSIYSFFPFIIKQFLIFFIALTLFFILIRKAHENVYKFFVVGFFIVIICLYIQGNYLIGNLPPIDGTWINFDTYKTEKIISILLWVITTGVILFCLYKFKFEKIEKACMYVSIAVIIMISTSMISLVMTPHFFDTKEKYFATTMNYNDISSDKNFYIFLIDAADSKAFVEGIERKTDINELLEDFTYYPNTTSNYLFTMFSIPYILGGEYYENDSWFAEYFTNSIDNSKLFSKLEEEGYSMNLYEDGELINYVGNNIQRFNNMEKEFKLNERELFNQELKYIAFKYLPFQLKWRARVDTFSLSKTKKSTQYDVFYDNNITNYNLLKQKLNVIDNKNFQFVHIEGAHSPFRYDKDLNVLDNNGTYEQNIDASVTILETYLNRLRSSDYFDNSVIIIMADHGYDEETIKRSNPILFIKGFNEKHEYKTSNVKISFENYQDAYQQLINGDTTDKLFQNLDNEKRRILYCEVFHCDTLTEMYQTGDSWNRDTIIPTGKEFKR